MIMSILVPKGLMSRCLGQLAKIVGLTILQDRQNIATPLSNSITRKLPTLAPKWEFQKKGEGLISEAL